MAQNGAHWDLNIIAVIDKTKFLVGKFNTLHNKVTTTEYDVLLDIRSFTVNNMFISSQAAVIFHKNQIFYLDNSSKAVTDIFYEITPDSTLTGNYVPAYVMWNVDSTFLTTILFVIFL